MSAILEKSNPRGGARDARLQATCHVERVDPLEVVKGGVRDCRLVAAPHVKRVDSLEVGKGGIRDTCAFGHDNCF